MLGDQAEDRHSIDDKRGVVGKGKRANLQVRPCMQGCPIIIRDNNAIAYAWN